MTQHFKGEIYVKLVGITLISLIFPTLVCPEEYLFSADHWVSMLPTLIIATIIWEGSRWMLARFQILFPWEKGIAKRIVIVFLSVFFYSSVIVLAGIYLLDRYVPTMPATPGKVSLLLVLTFLVTFLMTSIYEGIHLFRKWKMSLIEKERLQKENIQSQFESLKNQVNPHFLFNSLNALSSLVQTDPEKAVVFIDEFSKVYRYVLENKDKMVVPLQEELDFVRSYIYLQKIRFGDNLNIHITLDSDCLKDYLPPLSMQLLIENAIKHNEISNKHPLHIKLTNDAEYLVVENNLQLRKNDTPSTGIGLSNLKERYRILSNKATEFVVNNGSYFARIPLIQEEMA